MDVVRALVANLAKECEYALAERRIRGIRHLYRVLEKELGKAEFAVLVATPDDIREKDGKPGRVPRDNVVFDLDFSWAGWVVSTPLLSATTSLVDLPTDLKGLSLATYDSQRSDGDLQQAVFPATAEIIRKIRQAPRRPPTELSTGPSNFLLDEDALLDPR